MDLQEETLVILDYGSQYTKLIARRIRELGVFCLVYPYNAPLSKLKKNNVKGIILSGGPNSVYDKNAPKLNKQVLKLNIPVLGICYGLQLLGRALGGKVERSARREYGLSILNVSRQGTLINNRHDESTVWMSHGDHVETPPPDFIVIARSNGIIAAIENKNKTIFGLQFHPEVSHTKHGSEILENFLTTCKFSKNWSGRAFIDFEVQKIREIVGNNHIICALSGGVDSSVAATLVNAAIGSQQTCIFVDTGLLRKDEFNEVLNIYKSVGLNVKAIRARNRFLKSLKNIVDPERKRKIIGREFIRIFEEEARKIKNASYLVQGTLYPDVIESVSVHGPSATIKSHHNVGGLPKKMHLKLIEPLRELFKDEVRIIGRELGLPSEITQRQPFPGPGLAVRIIGKVTPKAIALLQEADAIVRSEIEEAKLHKKLWQYFAVLLPIKSVGVMGDSRTYEQVIAIRAVESLDAMTADWARLPEHVLEKISNRIIGEIPGINRVVYDLTSKPPGTIEWE